MILEMQLTNYFEQNERTHKLCLYVHFALYYTLAYSNMMIQIERKI